MPLSGVLEQLFNYWKSLPREGDNLLPARRDLLPTDLRDVMPRVSLLKRHQRYQVHVSMIGTAINTGWRSPFIGMNSFDLTSPSMRENNAKLYASVLDQPSGALLTENIATKNGQQRCMHSLYLPLADNAGGANYIIGCSAYRRKPCFSTTNERLITAHDHVMDVEFIDLGTGIPAVEFEKLDQSDRPALSMHWWNRFLPDWKRPKSFARDADGHRKPKQENAWTVSPDDKPTRRLDA